MMFFNLKYHCGISFTLRSNPLCTLHLHRLQNRRDLLCSVHRREGQWRDHMQTHPLQKLHLSPGHTQLRAPRRRLHFGECTRRRINLQRKIPRRVREQDRGALFSQAVVNGKFRAELEQGAVFVTCAKARHLDGKHVVFGRVVVVGRGAYGGVAGN